MSYYRRPYTTQERRAVIAVRGEVKVRAKRAPRSSTSYTLPTSWDDLRRCVQRTWKVHRTSQYRPL